MAENGLTQTDVAQILGVSQAAVARRLGGAVSFRVEELQAIASRTGVPIEALLRDAA